MGSALVFLRRVTCAISTNWGCHEVKLKPAAAPLQKLRSQRTDGAVNFTKTSSSPGEVMHSNHLLDTRHYCLNSDESLPGLTTRKNALLPLRISHFAQRPERHFFHPAN